jgi:ABC-type branched-subunit amino acid transport system ATPase component/ABC-type branched-subunit amino acid transport system permease subunit
LDTSATTVGIVSCFNGESVCLTRQVVFDGMSAGLVYGLLAMGIVLIYRSTKVINFAVGNMGLPGTLLFALLIINWGAPFWIALAVCLLVGALIGALIELTVVRRLFTSPRVILLVATVGVAQLMQAVLVAMPEVEGGTNDYPVAIGRLFEPVTQLRVTGPKLTIILVVPVVALLLGWLLTRTTFGTAVSASADNADLSRLSGVNPKVISTSVWIIGGFVSTLSMILLSGGGGVTGLHNLGPLTLTRALAAAVIAGMRSFPRAVIAGVAIGVIEFGLRFNFLNEAGLIDFILFLAVIVAVFLQSRSSDESVLAFAPKVRPIPKRLKSLWFVRYLPRIIVAYFFVIAFYVGHFIDTPSKLLLYSTIIGFAICGMSVTVITGWAGQLSLSQMAFAGIGALTAAGFTRGLEMDIGWRSTRIIDFQLDPLPFGVSILIATFTTAALAAFIGIGALRVRGLLLAVSTFAFAIAAQQYLYRRPFFSDGNSSVRFERGEIFGIQIAAQHRYFWLSLFTLALVVMAVSRLRHSGVGRTMIAVRDNADAASAYTVNPTRSKLVSFALAGGIAGFGGALLGGLVRNIRYSEALFLVGDSLKIVAIVVIGGLGSIIGPVIGAIWVEGLPAFWPDNTTVRLMTSSVGLLVVLMYFPGGFVQIAYAARDGVLDWLDRRVDELADREPYVGPATSGRDLVLGLLVAGVKLVISVALLVWAATGAVNLGFWSTDVDGVLASILVVAGLSGLLATAVLFGLARTPSPEVGSTGVKLAISGVVFVEPLVPFFWPAVFAEYVPRALGRTGNALGLRRVPLDAAASATEPPESIHRSGRVVEIPEIVLNTRDVNVHFGGNVAVRDVSISVHRDEIVGLIGTNGAGKSTLMNATGGYVSSTGSIQLMGKEVSGLSAPARARLGLGRTFQAATLFPELSVRETVMVALEARGHSSFVLSALHLNGPWERRLASEADELIDFLGLGRYADAYISDLSTGTRRIIEIANLLAVDAQLLCLDEPTAGVAQRETEAFGPLIKRIRAELGASMLIIEHDMPLIMSISDRVYCLEAGKVIAEGEPNEVRNDPAVIASYLGTDERAIERSGSRAPADA